MKDQRGHLETHHGLSPFNKNTPTLVPIVAKYPEVLASIAHRA